MQISLILMREIVQLFIILLMGYIIVRAKLLRPEDGRSLSVVMVYLLNALRHHQRFPGRIHAAGHGRAYLLLRHFDRGAHPVSVAHPPACRSAASGCDRTHRRYLHQRGYPGHPACERAARSGIRHLFLRVHRGAAGADLDALPQPALRHARHGMAQAFP